MLNAPDFLLQVDANSTQVVIGVLLKFVAAAANVAIGVLLLPVLKQSSESGAAGYLATRLYDGIGLVVSGGAILWLLALSQEAVQAGTHSSSYALTLGHLLVTGSETAFVVTMLGLGLGAMPFSYLLYRSRLIPRPMAVLGIISYASLFIGSLLELFGLNLNMLHFVPGGLFEFILPLWLFAKGFNFSGIASEPGKTALNEGQRRLAAA
jgi:hypothetical protein